MDPVQALWYNDHPLALVRDFPDEKERSRAIRQVEREIERWEAQQTTEQRAWRDRGRRKGVDPFRVARAIAGGARVEVPTLPAALRAARLETGQRHSIRSLAAGQGGAAADP